LEQYKYAYNRLMRYGFTTGTCAAAASKAAAAALITGYSADSVKIVVPKGVELDIAIEDTVIKDGMCTCTVIKDGGDDPDATHGLEICASVSLTDGGIKIDGGTGVGRVTKKGLDQPVGNAAINHVPRQMITDCLKSVAADTGYSGGFSVVISVPRGEEVGAKTFNPQLGIFGGISILGTSGVVEPMSDKAIVDTARVELNVLKEAGVRDLLFTIGNYGEKYAGERLHLDLSKRVKCSNFIGDTIGAAIALGFESVMLIGHIGKMVKLAAGITNTHSAFADARMDIMAACAVKAGGSIEAVSGILDCATTDAALDILEENGILDGTMAVLKDRIYFHLNKKFGGKIRFGALVFTNSADRTCTLITCGDSEKLLDKWRLK
jgi:cobalt-precorrin-5B (C1)-methyltransferase